ncbi:hypothetical protein VNO78_34381 [Psophocarpus tetragonolobus]|uniref:Uncharacterized protein n=1 Tax=Psophocarpus tetragonolobus TaxID=3891 RepID=A0AAN9NVJ6_PSOTE
MRIKAQRGYGHYVEEEDPNQLVNHPRKAESGWSTVWLCYFWGSEECSRASRLDTIWIRTFKVHVNIKRYRCGEWQDWQVRNNNNKVKVNPLDPKVKMTSLDPKAHVLSKRAESQTGQNLVWRPKDHEAMLSVSNFKSCEKEMASLDSFLAAQDRVIKEYHNVPDIPNIIGGNMA